MTVLRNGLIPLTKSHPSLVEEWDYEKNAPLSPADVSAGSNRKIWWKCSENHSYLCSVDHRTGRGQGCPYCSGKKVLKGYNDLKTRKPSLAEEWDYEKNALLPTDISLGSSKRVWWKCLSCGNSWQATPNDRNSGKGCPVCGKEKGHRNRAKTFLEKHKENLLSNNAELLKEWDYTKNSISPSEVLSGSSIKAWWICSICGNSWCAAISNRVNGSGCPKCMKHNRTSFPEQALYYYLSQVFSGVTNSFTDIFDNNMELDIYISDIETGIEYDGVAFHTGLKAENEMIKKYQICKDNGINLIRVSEFVNNVHCYDSCFVRDNNTDKALSDVIIRLLTSLTDVEVSVDVERDRSKILQQYITVLRNKSISHRYPEVAKKWDTDKNNGLLPDQVNAYSNKKFWWKCPLGHSYQATPANEVIHTKTCPICSNHRILPGFNDLATKLPSLAKEWDWEKNKPVKPTDVLFTSSKKCWWICSKGHSYRSGINNRYYGSTGCPYCSNTKVLKGYNDLETICPHLINEWNYDKNDSVMPSDILAGSNKKVWWICDKGHEWKASVGSRTGKDKAGCPVCSNHIVLTGFNDLATTHTNLLEEWDFDKNVDVLPTNIVAGSPRKVWWKCKTCGNEWKTGVALRTGKQKAGCPVCGYKIRQKKTNIDRMKSEKRSLSAVFPEIAKEWDYSKNTIQPTEVSFGSNIKVWWLCPKGHSYQSWLCDRTGKQKTGCPICSRKKLLSGENDLETLFPEVARDWDYEKNKGLLPSEITAQNGKKVWWKCSLGHSWEATVTSRTGKNKTGCPYCSNKKVLKGFNDLESQFPDLCTEWCYDKNIILPSEIVYGSGTSVWWRCSMGHEWKAKVVARTRGSGCKECYFARGKQNNRN